LVLNMGDVNSTNLKVLNFDALIVGGGGSGMRASLELAKSGLNTAVISKVFPTRSHTVSAQGGITCAIQSADPDDDWRWHWLPRTTSLFSEKTSRSSNRCKPGSSPSQVPSTPNSS